MFHCILIAVLLITSGMAPAVTIGTQRDKAIQAAREKLVGTWVGKVQIHAESLKQNAFVSKGLSDQQIQGVARAFQLLASLKQQTLTFEQDGTVINILTSKGKRQEKKGTWKLHEVQGNRLTVQFTYEDQTTIQMSFRMLDDNLLQLELKDEVTRGVTHRFTRQKPSVK